MLVWSVLSVLLRLACHGIGEGNGDVKEVTESDVTKADVSTEGPPPETTVESKSDASKQHAVSCLMHDAINFTY